MKLLVKGTKTKRSIQRRKEAYKDEKKRTKTKRSVQRRKEAYKAAWWKHLNSQRVTSWEHNIAWNFGFWSSISCRILESMEIKQIFHKKHVED